MQDRERRSMTGLIAAFVATFACFFASTVYTSVRLHELMGHSQDVSENALPSVVHVTTMRSELRRLERALDDGVDGRKPWSSDIARDAFRQIDEAFAAYDATPEFPGEHAVALEAERALADLRSSVERLSAQLSAGDAAATTTFENDVRTMMNDADDALRRLVVLNATYGAEASRKMHGSERRLTALAFGLDALSMLVSVVAGLLGLRMALRYTRLVQRRASELEEFAGRVAHDVRGPLAPAMMALETITRVDDATMSKRMAERGTRSLQRVVTLVDDLLAFAMGAAQPDAKARTSVREAVAGVVAEVETFAAERNVEVCVDPLDDVEAACAPGVLASILSNLVRNAIKYIGSADLRRVTIRAAQQDGSVRIEVEDTGPGIPAQYRNAVFEPYIRGPRTSEGGLGLGLATVKRLAEAHRGTVTFRSAEGQGTTFSVTLPTAPADVRPRGSGA